MVTVVNTLVNSCCEKKQLRARQRIERLLRWYRNPAVYVIDQSAALRVYADQAIGPQWRTTVTCFV